jgi:molybdate transport system substrate-binding protein
MRKLAGAALLVVALVGGSAGVVGATAPSRRSPASQPSGTITVSAAASLTEAFTRLGKQFEKRYRGTTVTFNFAASSALELQIEQGAPADVFASADTANMDELAAAGKVTPPVRTFAANRLEIVVKKGNPEKIRTLADLADVPTVALCASTVPCGRYAAQALQQAGVAIPESRITRGQDVKATLAAVSPGDASAAIVYVSDAKSARNTVSTVSIAADQNVVATYPIAALQESSNPRTARAFVKYVVSTPGRKALAKFGFAPPAGKN